MNIVPLFYIKMVIYSRGFVIEQNLLLSNCACHDVRDVYLCNLHSHTFRFLDETLNEIWLNYILWMVDQRKSVQSGIYLYTLIYVSSCILIPCTDGYRSIHCVFSLVWSKLNWLCWHCLLFQISSCRMVLLSCLSVFASILIIYV